ncbi:MAG: hypothetical protein LUE87_07935, partial [Lachnospiraceae bacterium]|nr:hypothetical protein [Lachnospiraceae bacterium]
MKLRLYVMDIRGLEEAALCAAAFRLLDSERKEKALRAGNGKDRARRVGAGLLLLLGHERMDGSMELNEAAFFAEEKMYMNGPDEKKGEEKAFHGNGNLHNDSLQNDSLQILSPAII